MNLLESLLSSFFGLCIIALAIGAWKFEQEGDTHAFWLCILLAIGLSALCAAMVIS